MAVVAVGAAGNKTDGTTSTHTLSYALDAAANFVRVSVGWVEGGITISGVTWNGDACTQVGSTLQNADGRNLAEFYRVSPTTGTHNLVVTMSGAVSGLNIAVQGYSGVDTGTPTSGVQTFTTTGAGDTASPTNLPAIASAVDDLVVASFSSDDTSGLTADVSQTVESAITDATFGQGSLDTSNKAGAASVTMACTFTGTRDYCALGYNLEAAAAGGRTTKNTRAYPHGVGLGTHRGLGGL
jgi:hypothetical protein